MQISKKILNLPPYLSTSWKNITSLYLDESSSAPLLKVALNNGTIVKIPGLDQESLKTIFQSHAAYLEQENLPSSTSPLPEPFLPGSSKDQVFGFKIPIGMEGNLANFGDMMQHNSEQMHAAPLPQEVLSKIAAMAQSVGMDASMFPKPEPHCNCPHCQMARAIHQQEEGEEEQKEPEEDVTEEDLRFREWDIEQTNDKLYHITNPLDKDEHFDVFLGDPVGCTCGEKNCEHIRVVLRS